MIRVLVVDDSSFIRRQLIRLLEAERDIEVVGEGADGDQALQQIGKLKPDVVTLDVEMPGTDGLTALRKLRSLPRRPNVLMCSTLTATGSRTAVEALSLGAADVIAKDTAGSSASAFRAELLAKVRAIGSKRPAASAAGLRVPNKLSPIPTGLGLIVIGSSTGGPPILEQIIRELPANPGLAIVVAQHMPAMFSRSLAERLDEICSVSVKMAVHHEPVTPGHVYICEGGMNTRVEGRPGASRFKPGRASDRGLYYPSADALLGSAAESYGAGALGVVLTGMGEDGKIGAGALRNAGASVIAQNEASCVVYGMPRAVVESGSASAAMDPPTISRTLASLAAASSGGAPLRQSA